MTNLELANKAAHALYDYLIELDDETLLRTFNGFQETTEENCFWLAFILKYKMFPLIAQVAQEKGITVDKWVEVNSKSS